METKIKNLIEKIEKEIKESETFNKFKYDDLWKDWIKERLDSELDIEMSVISEKKEIVKELKKIVGEY